MKIIEKKVWRKYFEDILEGKKNFEVRLGDFEGDEGDILILREWDEINTAYTGRKIEKKITYILKTKDLSFWTEEEIDRFGYKVISFK